MDVDAKSSSGKTKTVQQQRPKDATAMDLKVPMLQLQILHDHEGNKLSGEEREHTSSLGRKTKADNDLNESAAEEQRPNGSPSSIRKLIQSLYAEDAAATNRLGYRFLSGGNLPSSVTFGPTTSVN